MKLPLNWLKDFVNIDDTPAALADKLLNIGFEVEEIIYTGENLDGVVVGKILDIKKHFSADKLKVCTVDVGREITTIVTGANNVSTGDRVPVALNGAILPNGSHITVGDLRGVISYGMMCSGGELCIDNTVIDGAEVDGILILPPDSEIGADIKDVIGLNEYVLDISVPANRPDCQSVYGMAREIATLYGKKAKKPATNYRAYETDAAIPPAVIEGESACSIYTGRLITDVKIEPSPKWMRDRLRQVGIRAINNMVDITNYVLCEIGQPLHAFDVSNVVGRVIVRFAKKGEKIVALDGKEYALDEKMLVIADEKKALAIAGVMGGEYSGIENSTKSVFLEAARFAKESIRTTSRSLGLRSDSSARYEKGVDRNSVELGRERALALIHQLKAGKVAALKTNAETAEAAYTPKVIKTTTDKINDLFGITVKQASMVKILKSLEFEVATKGNEIICTVPVFREDIDNYTDLAEEIIRFCGYDLLESHFIKDARPTVGGITTAQRNIDEIKSKMIAFGAYECCTYSFINYKQYDRLRYPTGAPERNVIRLQNPLSEEFAVMRTQLVGSMLDAVKNNLAKKNFDFRLFEVAKVYIPEKLPLENLPDERDELCIAYVGKGESYYTLKAAVEEVLRGIEYKIGRSAAPYLHPGMSADIVAFGKTIGSFGKLHPAVAESAEVSDVYLARIDLGDFIGLRKEVVAFEPIPKFPAVERDLAVTVDDERSVGELLDCIKTACGALLESVEVFDVYRGEQIEQGKKSVAFSLKLLSREKTLIESEIQECVAAAVTALEQKYGARLRA